MQETNMNAHKNVYFNIIYHLIDQLSIVLYILHSKCSVARTLWVNQEVLNVHVRLNYSKLKISALKVTNKNITADDQKWLKLVAYGEQEQSTCNYNKYV